MVVRTRRATKQILNQAHEDLTPSDSEIDLLKPDYVGSDEDDNMSVSVHAKTRQARPRGRNKRIGIGFSVIRYRVEDFKQQKLDSPSHEFRSSLHTLQFDPASMCIPELIDPQVKEVIHRTATVFWPSFQVYTEGDLIAAWLELMYSSRVLFHAVLAGHGSMMRAEDCNSLGLQFDAFHHKHSTASIREWRRLAKAQQYATDDMLQATSYLAITPRPRSESYGRTGGLGFGLFEPPLRKLQALDRHAKYYFAEPHRSAGLLMVKQMGGMKTLRATGIAEAFQGLDLHTSAQAYVAPVMDLAQSAVSFIEKTVEPARQAWRGALAVNEHAESFAFDKLDLSEDVLNILVDMRVYSEDVRRFVQGDVAPNAKDMTMFRNMCVYHLLKVPAQASVGSASQSKLWETYELTRLGALLFAYGALYPSPPWDAKRQILEQLHAKVQSVVRRGLDGLEELEVSLLAWAAMMGCMMAVGPNIYDHTGRIVRHEVEFGTGEHDVFAKLLVWCQLRLGIQDFTQLKKEMQRWLWLDEACDEGGRKVWEVVKPSLSEKGDDDREDLSD